MAASASLADFVSSIAGGDGLRVEERLGSGYVRLRVAEAERRQAKHDIRCVEDAVTELLRNARDAGATRIFVAIAKDDRRRSVLVADDGSGIPGALWERVFDARVTSKLDSMVMDRWGVHGRGMALYSIRENAEAARVVTSAVGVGTAIECVFDTTRISERKDQSTWPELTSETAAEDAIGALTGPRNVIRACCEFALECEGVRVYVGSPSELVATVRARVRPAIGATPSFFDAIALAADARELRAAAAEVGVEMSERTAHRIVRGEIAPVRHARARLMGTGPTPARPSPSPGRIVLTDGDRRRLATAMEAEVRRVCSRYFADVAGEARVTVTRGRITVSVPIEDEA